MFVTHASTKCRTCTGGDGTVLFGCRQTLSSSSSGGRRVWRSGQGTGVTRSHRRAAGRQRASLFLIPVCVLVTETLVGHARRLYRTSEDNARLARLLAEAHRLAHLGTWEWDVGADSMTWSDEMYRLLGLASREVAATYGGLVERVHPEDRGMLQQTLGRIVRTGEPFDAEYRVVRPGGEVAWLAVRGEALREDGTVTRVRGVAQDITLAKQADTAVREQRDRLAAAVESTDDAVVTTDPQGRILDWNRGATRMYGYEREEVLGRPISILFAAQSRETEQATRMSLSEREHGRVETTRLRKDGTTLEVSVSLSMIRDDSGEVTAVVGIARDITESKQAQRAAAQAASDLAEQAEQLRRLAFHDPLTGLANRALFQDRLEHALAVRKPRAVSVLLLDLDEFKQVNDMLGHQAGDRLLVEVGRRLAGGVRPQDTVARLGGDEFAVLLDDAVSAEDVARRLLATLTAPVSIEDQTITPAGSLGIACSDDGSLSPSELLRQADVAMYAAKAAGKNGYQVFGTDMATTGLGPAGEGALPSSR
jgi:diguanylate cyclase (GGDEF)-like protein/PAS domain S-box-containing protein